MPAPGLDLAREYDVSAFVPAFASTLAAWGERARTVRNDLPGHYNLAYGPGAAEQLDLFCADTGPHAAPLLVFLHGGFWRRLHKDDFTWAAPAYVQRGVSVAIVNYGLAPATTLDTIVDQTRRAIAWLYRQADAFGIDRRRIVVAGHSAGGHLTCMALATDWPALDRTLPARLVAGGIALSPLADLAPLAHVPFLHSDLDFTPERIAALSPIHLRPVADTPLIGAVGGRESREFKRQLALLAGAWPDCWRGAVDMPADDHVSLCEAFAQPQTPLFQAALELIEICRA
jgi:arylformamidase